MYGGDGDDLLYGSQLADRLAGDLGDDLAYGGSGNDDIFGGDGADTLWGDLGNDRIDGGNDADILSGGSGNDRLLAGNGHDSLFGGHGDDRLYGGSGSDSLEGGSGVDIAVLPGRRIDYGVDRRDPSHVILRQGSDVLTLVDVEYLGFSDETVSNLNHAPGKVGDADARANQVIESAATGTLVGIIARSSDIDGDRLTYRLIDDADGRFGIDRFSGVVTVVDGQTIDHENQALHIVTVRASDRYGLFADRNFVIAISDEDEPLGIMLDADPDENAVSEDATAGTAVGLSARATDPDGGTLSYSMVDDAAGRFVVDPLTGMVRTAREAGLDYEELATHTVRIKASDFRRPGDRA